MFLQFPEPISGCFLASPPQKKAKKAVPAGLFLASLLNA